MTTKVLMVCLGNICRSPLAEGILKSKLNQDHFFVDSAGTSNFHEGERPDQRSIDVAQLNQIDISGQTSRPFTAKDFDRFDYIYVMDSSNYKDLSKIASSAQDHSKIKMIMNEVYESKNVDVPDPYHDSINGFKNVFEMLDEACSKIAERIANNN